MARRELATERLLLRPVEPGDAQALRSLAADEGAEPHGLLAGARAHPDGPGGPQPPAAGAVEDWIAEQQAGWEAGTHHTFAVRTRQGALVGVVRLRRSPSAPRAELGFATLPAARGRGYATEACRAVLQFAFTDLNLVRISALCLGTNQASVRVLEKLGFGLEARIERDRPDGGEAVPLLFYGLTRTR